MTQTVTGRAQAALDLCAFVDASPSPFHAVAEMARRLDAGGFTRLSERERWELAPGDARYVVREGSLAAFRVGSAPPDAAGFRLVGAHTDSPTFKVRPRPGTIKAGYRMVGVEVYGAPLVHTWMDRDLTAAGRVVLQDGSEHLMVLPEASLKLASLAIHLDRNVNAEGVKLNAQEHLQPLWSPADVSFLEAVAAAAGVDAEAVLGHDLVLADAQPAAVVGQLVSAPRLDNLTSCHAGLTALLAAASARATQLLVANDHEEVGSGSAEGAKGPFLEDVLARITLAASSRQRPGHREDLAMASARSLLVSCDAAHAAHPNYADRHEPEHRPRFGGGPVVKSNANQSYASDGRSLAWFAARCADAGVPSQHFVSRADLPCGSTIGPLTATRLGIATVDVGNPLLGMHSVRETGGAGDVEPMVAALRAHLEVADAW